MPRRTVLLAAVVAGLASAPAPTDACIHAAGEHGPIQVSQSGHQGLIIWADGREELVLNIQYQSGDDPKALGLVVPVPAVPSNYETAAGELFNELAAWVNLQRDRPQPRSRATNTNGPVAASAAAPPPLVVLPAATTGPYQIQPLQAHGEAGIAALTAWMEEHEFAPIPPSMLQHYAERGWTFLTVKVDPRAGGELSRSGAVPPLRVRFDTERALYPLKLEAQGTFGVRLYLVTKSSLPQSAFEGAVERGFELARAGGLPALGGQPGHQLRASASSFRLAAAPASLRAILEDIGGFADSTMTVRVLQASSFGQGSADPATWDEELSFPAVPAGQRLLGSAAPGNPAPPRAEADQAAPPEAEAPTGEAAEATPSEEATSAAYVTGAEDDDGLCAASGRPRPTSWLMFAGCLLLLVRRKRR